MICRVSPRDTPAIIRDAVHQDGSGSQVLLQADALFRDLLCGLFAHIAVMPGFIADAGQVAFIRRIPENEAVIGAVRHQPLLDRGLLLLLVQDLIARIHDIHRKAGLMLAGAGAGDPLGNQRLGLFLGETLLCQGVCLVLK